MEKPRVYNKYKDKNIPHDCINIMRPNKWGNPFEIGVYGNRAECIEAYKQMILSTVHLRNSLNELRGKNLLCCCKPLKCHGDFLLEEANK